MKVLGDWLAVLLFALSVPFMHALYLIGVMRTLVFDEWKP